MINTSTLTKYCIKILREDKPPVDETDAHNKYPVVLTAMQLMTMQT